MAEMVVIFYATYLVALLIVPLLVKWRWRLPAALIISIAEVGLVVLIWSVVPSTPSPIDPNHSPLLQIQRNQANAYLTLITMMIFPAIAALLGGALSLVWWMVVAMWRSFANRP